MTNDKTETHAEREHSIILDAIKNATKLIEDEIETGIHKSSYSAHKGTGTKKKYITIAYIMARTARADTGKPVNGRTIYKDTLIKNREELQTKADELENKLENYLNSPTTSPPTELEILKKKLAVLEAYCAKLKDHLHVCYARERQHRWNAKKRAKAKGQIVVSMS
jgi:hypothetical protein